MERGGGESGGGEGAMGEPAPLRCLLSSPRVAWRAGCRGHVTRGNKHLRAAPPASSAFIPRRGINGLPAAPGAFARAARQALAARPPGSAGAAAHARTKTPRGSRRDAAEAHLGLFASRLLLSALGPSHTLNLLNPLTVQVFYTVL